MRASDFLVCLTLLAAGCFTPTPADGAFACNPTGKACPDGYSCIEGSCWKNGHAPDLAVGEGDVDLAGSDGDMGPAKKENGDKCITADVCASGSCVDGVCCDTSCSGQCEACDTQALGTCTAVSGPPHGARSACGGVGSLCGGTCDGATRAACTYPSNQTICGAACDGNCNGAGACSSGAGGSCPNGFACGMNACLTSCSSNNECQPHFMCNAPNCVRVPESDCLDGLDNNGDGLADCADPSCTAQVSCVPAVGAGNEIGIFTGSACPATNYSMTEHLNQGLQVPTTCSGCNCSPVISCAEQVYFDYSTTTCGSATLAATWSGGCVSVGSPGNPMSIKEVPVVTANRCDIVQGTRDPLQWATSSNFCAASRSSATCGANQTCVAKPSTGANCARIPTPASSCPAGYTANPKGTWYGDGEYSDNRTCACDCSRSGGSCDYMFLSFGSSTCPISTSNGGFAGASCGKKGDLGFNSWGTISAIEQYASGDPGTKPTCTVSSTSTTGGTTATVTGGSTICCR